MFSSKCNPNSVLSPLSLMSWLHLFPPCGNCTFIQLQGHHYILIHVNVSPPHPPAELCNAQLVCAMTLVLTSLFSCYPTYQAAYWTFSLGCPIVTSNLYVKSGCLTLPLRLLAFPHLAISIQRNSIQPVLKPTSHPEPQGQILPPNVLSLLPDQLVGQPNSDFETREMLVAVAWA